MILKLKKLKKILKEENVSGFGVKILRRKYKERGRKGKESVRRGKERGIKCKERERKGKESVRRGEERGRKCGDNDDSDDRCKVSSLRGRRKERRKHIVMTNNLTSSQEGKQKHIRSLQSEGKERRRCSDEKYNTITT